MDGGLYGLSWVMEGAWQVGFRARAKAKARTRTRARVRARAKVDLVVECNDITSRVMLLKDPMR
jgi:hypothetical protein